MRECKLAIIIIAWTQCRLMLVFHWVQNILYLTDVTLNNEANYHSVEFHLVRALRVFCYARFLLKKRGIGMNIYNQSFTY